MSCKLDALIMFMLLLCGVAIVVVSPVAATDHIVGANKGWNPGINYTLWANNQTFYVGDYISFRYKKNIHNVYQVNKTNYDKCTIEGAIGNWTHGKDFIHLKRPGRYFFICGNIDGCTGGMKVSILVHSLAPSPAATASISATKRSSSTDPPKSAAAKTAHLGPSMVVYGGLFLGFLASLLDMF